jgi:hypothetical protein
MNVQPRKLGSLVLFASAALTFSLCISTAVAQEVDQQVEGWHDRSTSDEPTARAAEPSRPSEPSDDRPTPARSAESPRAGSPGYSPSYQQPQSDRPRTNSDRVPQNYDRTPQNYNRSPQNYDRTPQNYRQPNPNDRAPRYYSQYNAPARDPHRPVRQASDGRYYSDAPQGRTAGPYYGYPSTNARPVSYRRQDVEYVDDQQHSGPMPGQPSVTIEMPGQQGSPMMGPPMGGPEGGCGCADGNCPSCGCTDGSCDGNCGCDGWPRNSCRAFCDWCRQDAFRDLSVYAGVQGFKDPTDLGENGDFGFHEGANWGLPLWGCSGVGFQIGGEIDHSDLAPNATVFGDHRNQFFITSGVFYRPTRECGWQGGVVFDYLDDQFYNSVTVSQIRGNLSYVVDMSEFGFEFAAGTHDDTIKAPVTTIAALPSTVYSPVDLYTLYYGRRLANGGQVKAFAGLADGLGAIVGADLDIAISNSFSLEGDFAYVIPDKVAAGEVPGESANIAFSLVWHPGCHARDTFDSAYRPLFNVADNSSFILNRR